jgi:hypothetical protein
MKGVLVVVLAFMLGGSRHSALFHDYSIRTTTTRRVLEFRMKDRLVHQQFYHDE